MGKKIPKSFTPLIAAIHFVVSNLPVKAASDLMAFVLTKGSKFFIKPHNMQSNIRDVFPDMDEAAVNALTNQIVANFGRHVAEMIHMKDFRDGIRGARIDAEDLNGVKFDGNGPAIYVGGHIGSWELSPLVFHKFGKPLTVIYSQNTNPIIEKILLPQRNVTGAHYVEKTKALKPCYQALERGESIALLVDQRVTPGIDVDFFGRSTTMSRIPARLATNFDCPIIPFEVVRIQSGHLRIMFQDPILPNGQKGKQVEFELTQKIAHAVQNSILRNTETWFCNKLRWKNVDKEKLRLQALKDNEATAQTSDTL